ncbi:MAG: DUF2240 family protein [Candidatus Thalassarchaeaceae archaeon]|jgi:hypothetical protein|nr:DUF2240 family protein [Candidatus Thalassarchaeaceae archaeon]MDP7042536.1 DUF2240 family protein [Candidatus Thalassarchaeaceae archaeon]
MSFESEAVEDIQRLLAMTWRTWGNEPLDPNSITRTWSLDLGWLSPQDSENLLTKLIAKGWLDSSDDGLIPKSDFSVINVPLGWFPRQRLLDDPPVFSEPSDDKVVKSELKKLSTDTAIEEDNLSGGGESIVRGIAQDSFDVPALLQLISKESKLPRQEVMKRAQRKRKSLGTVTIWMALFLVARELGVDVNNLID